jgi:hypothetical protein
MRMIASWFGSHREDPPNIRLWREARYDLAGSPQIIPSYKPPGNRRTNKSQRPKQCNVHCSSARAFAVNPSRATVRAFGA